MHPLLQKWLKKRKIKSPEELDNTPMPDGSPTEKESFEQMTTVLAKKELTLADIEEFCQGQVGIIELKWADHDVSSDKKNALIPYHTVYNAILNTIKGHQETREAVERQLQDALK